MLSDVYLGKGSSGDINILEALRETQNGCKDGSVSTNVARAVYSMDELCSLGHLGSLQSWFSGPTEDSLSNYYITYNYFSLKVSKCFVVCCYEP